MATTRPACFNDSTPLGRIWNAGVLPSHSAKDRIPLITAQTLQDCHEIIMAALNATQSGSTPAPKLDQATDNPLLLIFTNPRITGTILLGLCKILYWNVEGFGEQIKGMLQKIIEQNTLRQLEQRRALMVGEDDGNFDESEPPRAKRRQRTRKVPEVVNGSGEGGTGGAPQPPPSAHSDDTESDRGDDEEWVEHPSSAAKVNRMAAAAEPAKKLLMLLEKKPAQLDMSWLCHPDTENLMSMLQSEMESSSIKLSGLGEFENESLLDEEEAPDGPGIEMEDENEDISAFFTGGASPQIPKDLPNLSPRVAGATPARQAPPEDEEVTFAHPLTARGGRNDGGASVRPLRKSQLEQPEEEELYVDPLAHNNDRDPVVNVKTKKDIPSKERRLLPMWDESIAVTEHRLVEGSGCLEYPARTFDWRASTAIPSLYLTATAQMCMSTEDRFRLYIKSRLLHSKQFSWEDDAGSKDRSDEQILEDSFPDLPMLTPHDRRRHRDSEMSFDNLDSSVVDSSEKPGTGNFPHLDSISSSNDLSSILRMAGIDPPETPHDPLEASPEPFTTAERPTEGPAQARSVGTRGTVTSAESAYEVNTWTLRCFIGKLLHGKATASRVNVDTVYTTFSEIVPTSRCNRIQAAITLKHVLVLATAGDLKLHQRSPDDPIEIRMGKQSRIGALPASSSEASDSFASHGKRPADETGFREGEAAKRRKTDH